MDACRCTDIYLLREARYRIRCGGKLTAETYFGTTVCTLNIGESKFVYKPPEGYLGIIEYSDRGPNNA